MISNQKDITSVSAEITNLVFKTIDISQLSDLDALNKINGLTEALNELGQGSNGVIIFHSLSKRSSAAGLRAGFIAGDKVVIEKYRQLVANGGVSISEPQLRVAEALYKDEKHVVKNRQFYDKNFQLSEQILKSTKPQGGFFNFIPVNCL